MLVRNLPIDFLVVVLLGSWIVVLLLLVLLLAVLFWRRDGRKFRYPMSPLEEAHRGLTRLVEEADWLEGEKLILAVRHVALAKEAIERAAKACGKSNLGLFRAPSPLMHVLEEGTEILGGSSAVLSFDCRDCGQKMSAMVQFPRVGGRPESTDPLTISATADWRETGFTVSMPCKRCKKLLTKKYLYDPLPV